MREVLDRAELHALFMAELRRHPNGAGSEFAFEIEEKLDDPAGCNWYPLAALEQWRGDLMSNLNVFRDVRERLSARSNVVPRPQPALAQSSAANP